MKKITSFTHHVTGEGSRISATYSTIDDDGRVIDSNKRFDIVVIDDAVLEAVNLINEFLLEKVRDKDE